MEIGIRRSAGARSRDIALQFQCEALLLGLSGGALGLLAGIAASLAFAEPGAGTSWLSLSGASLLAGIAALIGLAAGILPARRASRIDPASALHQG
jgi:putative ABC transport system permease protein